MAWFEMTRLDDRKVYVNSDQIIQIDPSSSAGGEGAVLITTAVDKDGKAVKLHVREPASELFGWFSAAYVRGRS